MWQIYGGEWCLTLFLAMHQNTWGIHCFYDMFKMLKAYKSSYIKINVYFFLPI